MSTPTSRVRSLLVMVSLLVGVVAAAGGHLLWLDSSRDDTTLAHSSDLDVRPPLGSEGVAGAEHTTSTTPGSSEETPPATPSTTTSATPDTASSPEPPTDSSTSPPSEPDDTTPGESEPAEHVEPAEPEPEEPAGPVGAEPGAAVVELVNAERADAGCGPVRADHRLRDSAQAHSDDMAEHGYLSHTSQDGTTFDERISDAGYPSPAAENIAMGMASADAVMEAWMNSDGHRRNILNCDISTIGVGVNSDGWYWTQNFGY
ncbi:CAP domain-containing protein [Saccharomonospora piscinae]|uniref:CAP domain-containing protein n=1 Tax=Saccharomonospora piscinae TaxID=687388 RepID=UPI001FC8EBFA|nr:CAP domain-containing protein [Saccharomonospora piscinae]